MRGEITRRRTRAANQIQRCFREHALELRANRFLAKLADQDAAQQAAEDLAAEPYTLSGVARRCWPVVREALIVMLAAAALTLLAPRPFDTLPGAFHVDEASTATAQLLASLAGAATLVGVFLVLFVVMFGLYVHNATNALLALHSLYVGALLAPPFALLIVRCAQASRAPLDAPLLLLLTQVTHSGPTLSTVAQPRAIQRPNAPGVGLAQLPRSPFSPPGQ